MYLARSTVAVGRRNVRCFSTATDYFAALRWRATEALTSIMTKEEREELLKRMDVSHVNNEKQEQSPQQQQEDVQKTIAEAVVAARTQEAQRQEAQWEREKERLQAEAEKAAYERVEADLRIQQQRAAALEKWQADVARETIDAREQQNGVAAKASVDEHPVLGEVIADFGFKRLHVVSAKTLSNIPVWKKQRIYRHDRAKAMAADKAKSPHFLPGVIALHEDTEGKLTILDGQHRVGMMTIMEEKKTELSFDLDRVLVEVFPETSHNGEYENYAQDIFTEINKAEPIKLVDMPGVASKTDRKVITEGAARLQDAFPEMFKPSQRCRAPHLNIDNLRDALFASDIIKRHNLKSPKALHDWMMEQNDLLRTQFEQEEHASKVSKAALQKANKFDFYLGLDLSWLYN